MIKHCTYVDFFVLKYAFYETFLPQISCKKLEQGLNYQNSDPQDFFSSKGGSWADKKCPAPKRCIVATDPSFFTGEHIILHPFTI
jgi:hypothetical protein